MTDRGLTPFLVGMIKADSSDLQRARLNADKVAQRHGIPVEWVRFNLDWWGHR